MLITVHIAQIPQCQRLTFDYATHRAQRPLAKSPLILRILTPLPTTAAGGYLVFIALEALRGKKLDEGVEKAVQAGGFLILMTAGVSLIVKDTLNLTGLGSMFQ